MEREERQKEEKRKRKITFWNVAGVWGKDEEFWKQIRKWDVIVMIETWIEEKGWEKVKERLPKEYEWDRQAAGRRNRKGRAIGGLIMGVKKELRIEGEKMNQRGEGMIEWKVKIGKEVWRIGGIYIREGMKERKEELREWIEEKGREEEIRVIGGDFNARTGKEGGGWREEQEGEEEVEEKRKSKDNKINKEGRILLETLEGTGWGIWNGTIEGDEEGEYTYIGARGNTVIDYVIGEESGRVRTRRLEVGEEVDSDHHPITIEIKDEDRRMEREREERGKGGRWRGEWNEERKERLRREVGKIDTEKNIQEEGERLKEKIRSILKKWERESEKESRHKRGWWDNECRKKKKELRRELRKWRKGTSKETVYKRMRTDYREMCERKKKEEKRKWEERIKEAKTERKVWEIINKERKKRKKINEEIDDNEWKEYFMDLLGGVERKVVKGKEKREERKGEGGERLEREEVMKAIEKLKDGKAAGIDEIPGEIWKYGGEEVREWIWKKCNEIWKGKGWPEEWKEGIIIPLIKKGEGKVTKEYRGITLMTTQYKIYTSVLAEKIRKECEEKRIIPHNQTGFREGMGTIDNIYALNYMINKRTQKKGKELMALFVDLKAAFDSVDKGKLIEEMKKLGIGGGLVERVEEVIKETKSRVKIGKRMGESFWTGRGLRQGCPLSPILFNIMIADLEEQMRRGRWGGVRVGERKIHTMAYADDIVMVAEDEEGMKSMMRRMERYLEEKGLELNAEKTKIMRFRKGGGRKRKINWWWKGKKIEEVKEFKYLGYTLQRNGGQEAHIRERIRRGITVMKQVWGIGKRRFGKEWGKRLWLFDRLVWTVIGYGVEIWGWKEREKVEKIHEKYLKWILGVRWRTPGYLVREELQRRKIRERAGIRAWNFERRMAEGRGSEITRSCWEEMKERVRSGGELSEWEKERKDLRSRMEMRGEGREGEEEEREREEEEEMKRWIEEEGKEQEKENWEKIGESRYSKWYRRVKRRGIPEYLKKGWTEERWVRVARFRMGEEMREGRYWEEDSRRRCRLCEREEETWEHVWERCRKWKEGGGAWQEQVDKILGDEGEGEKWMREVEEERRRYEGRGEGEEGGEGREAI